MIQTYGLGKQFGSEWVVKDVSLEVSPGEVLALLGQNGAGKTTTIRMLASILSPSTGTAQVMGYDVIKAPQKVRSVLGVLTEQHGLYLRMTGWEYLDYFGRIYHLDGNTRRRRNEKLLEYFMLAEVAAVPIGKYSKGMRQKLALARSLIHEPPVLLLDEPTSAMDPELALLVRNAILNLRKEKRCIIICTHNLVEAEMLADTIAIIHHGKILSKGSIAELKHEILGPMKFMIQVKNIPKGFNLELPSEASLVSSEVDHLIVEVRNPAASNPLIIKALISAGVEVISFQEMPRSLEAAYLEKIRQAHGGRDI